MPALALLALNSLLQAVVVNLLLRGLDPGLMGLDGHVCEVQLVLRAFEGIQVFISHCPVLHSLHFLYLHVLNCSYSCCVLQFIA